MFLLFGGLEKLQQKQVGAERAALKERGSFN